MTGTKDQFQMNLFDNQFNRIRLLVSFSPSPIPLCMSLFFRFYFHSKSEAIRLHCIRFYRLFYDRWNEISLLSACIFSIHCGTTVEQFAFVINELLFSLKSIRLFVWLVRYNARERAHDTNREKNILKTFMVRWKKKENSDSEVEGKN